MTDLLPRAHPELDKDLRDALHAAQLRATPARMAVLQVLRASEVALSHGEVGAQLATGPWDRATLYRNLLDLVRAGLARRVDVGDHTWRFEAATPRHDRIAHPHFLCTHCGISQCLPEIAWQPPETAPQSLRTQQVEVQIKGVCDTCL